jgi:glutamate dehydrogenase/leucine dehydrogenase
VNRRLPPLLLEASIGVPSPRALAAYTLGGRFVAFALVYGVLFGVAFAVGRRRESTDGESVTVLATGVAGALAALVATGATLLVVDSRQGLVTALAGLGGSAAIGVQLAVVAFAGLALAERV